MKLQKIISLKLKQLLTETDSFAVAVSGGADSMALCLLAHEFAMSNGKQMLAITVDHNLRSESASEALTVHKWLNDSGISHEILKWEGLKKDGNVQGQAREARYQLIAEFLATKAIGVLLTAHHSEDQAETVLLRIMRGSGVDGLAAISEINELYGIKVIRPLLSCSKVELCDYLTAAKQEWVEDPSNSNEKYLRVWVRNFLNKVEDKELLQARLNETARSMRRAKEYIEICINKELEFVTIKRESTSVLLDLKKFLQLHEEAVYRILSKILLDIGGKPYKPRFYKLDRLYKMLINNSIKGCYEIAGCGIKCDAEGLLQIYKLKNNNKIIP